MRIKIIMGGINNHNIIKEIQETLNMTIKEPKSQTVKIVIIHKPKMISQQIVIIGMISQVIIIRMISQQIGMISQEIVTKIRTIIRMITLHTLTMTIKNNLQEIIARPEPNNQNLTIKNNIINNNPSTIKINKTLDQKHKQDHH